MGTTDRFQIIFVGLEPPLIKIRVAGEVAAREIKLDEEAARNFTDALNLDPFGEREAHSYWLNRLNYTPELKFLGFRFRSAQYTVGARIKHGRSRELMQFSCSEDVYNSLLRLFPGE